MAFDGLPWLNVAKEKIRTLEHRGMFHFLINQLRLKNSLCNEQNYSNLCSLLASVLRHYTSRALLRVCRDRSFDSELGK
ncbi:hypothetical protein PUN28_006371 [Cardiocondyla obscurior]|uniref:Uncharacterized protein n=1 Tax=Cardiocondyla obscurior TaxID=286306 RepID=A0AAW2GA00_9HYME